MDDQSLEGLLDDNDLFSILETLEGNPDLLIPPFSPVLVDHETAFSTPTTRLVSQNSTASNSSAFQDSETDPEPSPSCKRQKVSFTNTPSSDNQEVVIADGPQRMMHITVERNRRKQMNEHLSVLRTLMPCFYVKRGDQASIIGGVADYIKELQQVLQSLEAKKQRKVYSEVVLSPRLVSSSPRLSPMLSPRKPPLSPRVRSLPISPRTPQPSSPYKPRVLQTASHELIMPSSSTSSSNSSFENNNSIVMELAANSKSSIADVEVKFSGPNVLLKTVSPRIPGQALKIIAALEGLELEILHVSISTIDDALLNSFTIKIGVECKLSAEELAHEVQQTFC